MPGQEDTHLDATIDDETLFLRSLDDLHQSINSSDPYRVLRSAGIVRQLLLDGSPLFDRVNRERRHRLRFRAVEQDPPTSAALPKPQIWSALSVDPYALSPTEHTLKTRDQFLSLRLGIIDDQEYTVRDVIKFVANVMGGVHAGKARSAADKALSEIRHWYVESELSVPLMQMRSIGRCVLDAFRDVKYDVLGLSRFVDAPGRSIHLVAALLPMPSDEPNWILDIGTQSDRNRVSVYLDPRSELNLRYLDPKGETQAVRAGEADCAFAYGVPSHLVFELGVREGELMLLVEAGGWFYVDVKTGVTFEREELHFVLGSDVSGIGHSHMAVMAQAMFSRCLSPADRRAAGAELMPDVDTGLPAHFLFSGNQFMHSTGHPGFADGRDSLSRGT